MKIADFEKFAGLCAILAGVAGFLYSAAFIVIARTAPNTGALLSAFCLTLDCNSGGPDRLCDQSHLVHLAWRRAAM